MRFRLRMKNKIRCAKRSRAGAEEEEDWKKRKNKIMKILKKCSLSMILHDNKPVPSLSWSDLHVDMLREIDKKLWYYNDHIRFRAVCKSWRAVGEHAKRSDVPWMLAVRVELKNKLLYNLNEPHDSLNPVKSESAAYMHDGSISLRDYFDRKSQPNKIFSTRYVDGWLHISVCNYKTKRYNFILFCVRTEESFTLPQLKHQTLLALSAAPDSPDCVFLALHVTDNQTRTIHIMRRGDTHWTSTESVGGWFGIPRYKTAVFIRGVFYFYLTTGIGSYDLATGVLKVDHYSDVLEFYHNRTFFGLDGDLMLAYLDRDTRKLCIRRYDWSNKNWVPLQSLGGRSMYLTSCSVYVNPTNCCGISTSANKIYVLVHQNSRVDEYILENGELSKCSSQTLKRWGSPYSFMTPSVVWVESLR